MRRLLAFALVLIGSAGSARADVTLYNFAATFANADPSRRLTEHALDGGIVDAHAGNIMQDGSFFYHYGERHAGGFRWRTATTGATGFNVYRSTDLVNKTRRGYILDPASTWTLDHCQPINTNGAGCFRPHMEKDATNGNYGFWFNGYNASQNVSSNLYYMSCTLPDDGSTCTTPVGVTIPTTGLGDHFVFTDPSDNSMYLAWSEISSRDVSICKLTTARTGCNGSAVLIAAAAGENIWGFVRASTGKVYVGFGLPLCGYCSTGSGTSYAMASTPLGTYSAPTAIDTSTSCNSQPTAVNKIVSGGQTTYLYQADSYTGVENQGWADQFFYPLAFTSDAINTIPCATSVTVPGVTSAGSYPTPSEYPNGTVDQSDLTSRGVFNDRCYVSATIHEAQTFIPTSANLYAVAIPLAINQPFGGPGTPNEPTPDGSVVAKIRAVDGSHHPTGAVIGSSVTKTAASLPWSTQWTQFVFNMTGLLTPGTEYAFSIEGSGMTTGCFTDTISQYSNVYPSGVHSNSTNSGSTWSTNANFAMMFATYSSAASYVLPPLSGMTH